MRRASCDPRERESERLFVTHDPPSPRQRRLEASEAIAIVCLGEAPSKRPSRHRNFLLPGGEKVAAGRMRGGPDGRRQPGLAAHRQAVDPGGDGDQREQGDELRPDFLLHGREAQSDLAATPRRTSTGRPGRPAAPAGRRSAIRRQSFPNSATRRGAPTRHFPAARGDRPGLRTMPPSRIGIERPKGR